MEFQDIENSEEYFVERNVIYTETLPKCEILILPRIPDPKAKMSSGWR